MKRKLGKFESASAISAENTAWNIVVVTFLNSVPSLEIMRQALNILQDRHPFLRVRLLKEKNSYFFESVETPFIPIRLERRENDEHWVSIVEEDLNHQFDHSHSPLMACTLLSGEMQQGEIILTAHHSIGDGISIQHFSQELLELCAMIHSGNKPTDYGPLDPLLPVESYFPDEYRGFALTRKSMAYFLRQAGDEFKYQMATRGKRKPPINTDARVKIIDFNTSVDITTPLVQRSRKEKVTLNSVLNAAVLLAVQRQRYDNAIMPYRYMSMADLRPYLTPPTPPNHLGSYIAPMRYTMLVQKDDDLWSLSHRINEQIYQSLKKGEKYLASIMSEQFLKMTFSLKKFRMCTTAISYIGPSSQSGQTYGPYEVRKIRGFVSNFVLGPEFSGVVGLSNGELTWDMLYLDTDMDLGGAQMIVNEIDRLLRDSIINGPVS